MVDRDNIAWGFGWFDGRRFGTFDALGFALGFAIEATGASEVVNGAETRRDDLTVGEHFELSPGEVAQADVIVHPKFLVLDEEGASSGTVARGGTRRWKKSDFSGVRQRGCGILVAGSWVAGESTPSEGRRTPSEGRGAPLEGRTAPSEGMAAPSERMAAPSEAEGRGSCFGKEPSWLTGSSVGGARPPSEVRKSMTCGRRGAAAGEVWEGRGM